MELIVMWEIAMVFILWPKFKMAEIPDRKSTEFQLSYNNYPKHANALHKVSLTQKGYIQFLRYVAEAPVITEFTFCIWLKSSNFTYAHPLLSYSKHETRRLIRAWISPFGTEINMAIFEIPVVKLPIYFVENHWYHICNSWDSREGFWSFYLNGKLIRSGYKPMLKGLKIPEKGDIVVGQEYTDFDKGLDDGIEGDVFGFNMVLSSTATTFHQSSNNFITSYKNSYRRIHTPNNSISYMNPSNNFHNFHQDDESRFVAQEEVSSDVFRHFPTQPNRQPKLINQLTGFLISFKELFKPQQSNIKKPSEFNGRLVSNGFEYSLHPKPKIQQYITKPSNIRFDDHSFRINGNYKSLGLELVELSLNCGLGRGSPLNHKKLLVSWTKTPVRVFGGAILINVEPFCYK